MELTLSVFFNTDRTYVALVDKTAKGLDLVYVNSTDNPINLEHQDEINFSFAVDELTSILNSIDKDIEKLTVTVPAETILVSQFPGREGISNSELIQLVNLEIRQNYPRIDYEQFSTNIIPLHSLKDRSDMIMAIIMYKQDIENYKRILRPVNQMISNIEISQLNAHSAFIYNYPEHSDKTILLLGIQNNFIDVSIISNKKPVYYNLVGLPDIKFFQDILFKEFDKLLSDYTNKIDGIYFFGTGLTKEHIEQAKYALRRKIDFIGRLNAFRMITTSLSQRDKEYCSRVSHIFAPCIGGAFPSYHERFKLY